MTRAKPAAFRTALVTGANRGLGLETCRQLAGRGIAVVLSGRDPALVAEAVAGLAATGLRVRGEALDVASEASVAACAARLEEARCQVDILVNNAAVYPEGGALDATDAAWREAVEANFMGVLRCCRAWVPGMAKRKWGRVVNVSSGYGAFAEGLQGPAPYAVTKAALNALTLKLASETPSSVKVNACCPGWVRTRMGGAGADISVEEGADTIVWLATLPDDGPTGGFFRERLAIPW